MAHVSGITIALRRSFSHETVNRLAHSLQATLTWPHVHAVYSVGMYARPDELKQHLKGHQGASPCCLADNTDFLQGMPLHLGICLSGICPCTRRLHMPLGARPASPSQRGPLHAGVPGAYACMTRMRAALPLPRGDAPRQPPRACACGPSQALPCCVPCCVPCCAPRLGLLNAGRAGMKNPELEKELRIVTTFRKVTKERFWKTFETRLTPHLSKVRTNMRAVKPPSSPAAACKASTPAQGCTIASP